MLKNKKAVYLLIPLNLAIWGFFIYRFWAAYHESDLPATEQQIQFSKFKSLKDSVTYTLSLNYKDPFLRETERSFHSSEPGNNSTTSTPSAFVKKEPAPAKTQPISTVKLPEIKYLGLIKNSSSGLITALVSVNGQSRLIKPNETVDGVVFKSFNNDSLVAKWGKERIVARK